MVSTASDGPNDKSDFLVSIRAVRKRGKILGTHVLINYGNRKSAETKPGNHCDLYVDHLSTKSIDGNEPITHITDRPFRRVQRRSQCLRCFFLQISN
jgi:hypothetical protein